jgi:hypothetical protein
MELHACLLFLTVLGIHRLYLSKPFKPKAFQGTINFVGKTGERRRTGNPARNTTQVVDIPSPFTFHLSRPPSLLSSSQNIEDEDEDDCF